MAGKVLEYVLTYRNNNGEEISRDITISFVSNFINKEFSRLRSSVVEFTGYTNRLSDIISEITSINIEKEEGYKDKIAELTKEKKALTEKIMSYKGGAIVDDRFKLVKEILVMNGYNKDDEICTEEFWDRYTDAPIIYDFLLRCVSKDTAESKKKDTLK